ncbi:MAG: peptidylprolyl isomerase [Alphaproteobacteria bacterium]
MRTYHKKILIPLYSILIGTFALWAQASLELPPLQQEMDLMEAAEDDLPLSPIGEDPKSAPLLNVHINTVASQKVHTKKGERKIEIAAVVNDDIISTKDLEDRLRLVLGDRFKALSSESDDYKKIRSIILKQLIDERLQIQVAKKSGLSVSDKEIDETIRNIEKQNSLSPGGLKRKLVHDKVPFETLREKIWAQIAWSNLIGASYRDVFRVSKLDEQETIRKLAKKTPQFQLAEIVVYVDDPSEEDSAFAKINAALEALKKGQPFIVVAQQLSDSPSALRGGDIGWIAEDQLDDQILEVLRSISLNHSTAILRTEDGYQILFLRDRINFEQMEEVITARQLEIKISDDIAENPEKLAAEKKRLDDLVSTIKNCQDFDQLTEQIENSNINIYKNVRIEDLSPDLQMVLANLRVNEPSSGIINNNVIVYFIICHKGHLHPESMTKEQTLDQISNQRFEAIAQQKIRDLRRVAAIDIRV